MSCGALPTVTTTTVYDAYGNPTTIAASTGDGYSKTTTNTYAVDTANWFLGRLPDQGKSGHSWELAVPLARFSSTRRGASMET